MREIDEDLLYATHAAQIRSAQPRFEKLISEITGWQGVEDLAKRVVELLITNQGGTAMRGVRPPCWQTRTPATVAEFTNLLVQASRRLPDDPIIQTEVAVYQQRLRDQFGL